jgi:hypothetical protein
MVQGPYAHVVLHDKIYVDFTDLLTVIEFTSRVSLFAFSWPSQESDRTEIWFVQSFHLGVHIYKVSEAPAVMKCALLTDDDDGQQVIV